MQDHQETTSYKIGRFMGQAFAFVIGGCLAALIIAATVKLISWLF